MEEWTEVTYGGMDHRAANRMKISMQAADAIQSSIDQGSSGGSMCSFFVEGTPSLQESFVSDRRSADCVRGLCHKFYVSLEFLLGGRGAREAVAEWGVHLQCMHMKACTSPTLSRALTILIALLCNLITAQQQNNQWTYAPAHRTLCPSLP